MAIFGTKKKEEKQAEATVDKTAATPTTGSSVIIRPHITEKAFAASQRNVYTFEIQPTANKYEVKAAIQAIYNVVPKKVRIVNRRPRVVRSLMRSKPMHKSGMSKAYVYLKEGDTINFM